MDGWRIGYLAAPKVLIDEMEKLMEHMVSGVTAVAQRAALAAITGPQDCVAEMRRAYEQRRAIVHRGLNEIEGISCLLPEGTFYAFPNISRVGLRSWELAKYLVQKHRVALVPGSIFGPKGEGYLRLSFAAGVERLQEGIPRIKKGIETLKQYWPVVERRTQSPIKEVYRENVSRSRTHARCNRYARSYFARRLPPSDG
jgi:aspartate/methionine/tyrosine aminotransferase